MKNRDRLRFLPTAIAISKIARDCNGNLNRGRRRGRVWRMFAIILYLKLTYELTACGSDVCCASGIFRRVM